MRKTTDTRRGGMNQNQNRYHEDENHDDVMTLCPRCQYDLSYTIEDTFLIRKALQMESTTSNVPDSELSAAELRFKHSVTPQQIEEAKDRLNQFQIDIENGNINPRTGPFGGSKRKNNTRAGSGIDIDTGASSTASLSWSSSPIMNFVEFDLFDGMKDILTEAEQSFVSDLMTSGEVEKLAQASQILYELKRIKLNELSSSAPSSLSSYFYQSQSNENEITSLTLTDAEKRALRMAMTMEERSKLERIERYLEINPLPPMPKFVILEADFHIFAKHGKVLKFRDDVWDGSMADAFARVYTTNSRDHNDNNFNSGVRFQNDEEGGFVNGNTREERQNRVLIYAARKKAAQYGVEVGDVVTHFDGEEFLGAASDLRELIHNLYLMEEKTFSMVLNAEQSTADALKDYVVELQNII